MSYDLHIATRTQPKVETVREFAGGFPDLTVSGQLTTADNVVVARVHGEHALPIFLIEAARMSAEGVLDPLADAVPDVEWSVFISVPGLGKEHESQLARLLAVHLAQVCQGAAFDPQSDELLWPVQTRIRETPPTKRVSVVRLEWAMPLSRLNNDAPRVLLQCTQEHLPEAIPRTFGGRKITPGDEQEFAARWHEEAQEVEGSLDLWEWSGKWPAHGGFAYVHRRYDRQEAARVPAWTVSMNLDGETVYQDHALCERVVRYFQAVSSELYAFYGAGTLGRGYVLERKKIYVDAETEFLPVQAWEGLPSWPAWLTWFGPTYAELVRDSLTAVPVEVTTGGVLVRMGKKPLHRDDLATIFPKFPVELMGETDPARRFIPTLA